MTTTTNAAVRNERFAHLRELLRDPEFTSAIEREEATARAQFVSHDKQLGDSPTEFPLFAVAEAEERVREHFAPPARIPPDLSCWIRHLHWVVIDERANEALPWASSVHGLPWFAEDAPLPGKSKTKWPCSCFGRMVLAVQLGHSGLVELEALAERAWSEIDLPARAHKSPPPTTPAPDDDDFKPANYFTKKVARRIRTAALPARQTMRVRKIDRAGVTLYSLLDCKRNWPGEKLTRE